MAKPAPIVRDRKAEVVRLRIDMGLAYKAIAAVVGCTPREAQYVMERYAVTSTASLPRPPVPGPSFTHRWVLRRRRPERFGHPCRLVGGAQQPPRYGTQFIVEFVDGVQEVATYRAVRKIEPMAKWLAAAEARRGK